MNRKINSRLWLFVKWVFYLLWHEANSARQLNNTRRWIGDFFFAAIYFSIRSACGLLHIAEQRITIRQWWWWWSSSWCYSWDWCAVAFNRCALEIPKPNIELNGMEIRVFFFVSLLVNERQLLDIFLFFITSSSSSSSWIRNTQCKVHREIDTLKIKFMHFIHSNRQWAPYAANW